MSIFIQSYVAKIYHQDKDYLTRHAREVHHHHPGAADAPKPEPCPQCGKLLASRRAFAAHMKRVHERNSFRHTCEDCGQSFPYLNTLQIHAEMAHMKGTLHVCQVVGVGDGGEAKGSLQPWVGIKPFFWLSKNVCGVKKEDYLGTFC